MSDGAVAAGDLAVARHLVKALGDHRVRVERDGGAVPDFLRVAERWAQSWLSTGQGGSKFGATPGPADPVVMTPRLLTYQQTADALALSLASVKRLVSTGELQAVHIGGAARIRIGDLDAFVASLGRDGSPRPDTKTAGAA